MIVAWPATVGSSASTAVTRMTEVPVGRERKSFGSSAHGCGPHPTPWEWMEFCSSLLPKATEVALCQRGHHESRVLAVLGLARSAHEGARENRCFLFVGEMKILGGFSFSESEGMCNWERTSREVEIIFLSLWRFMFFKVWP